MRRLIVRLCGAYCCFAIAYGLLVERPSGRNFSTDDIVMIGAGLLLWLSSEWAWYRQQSHPNGK